MGKFFLLVLNYLCCYATLTYSIQTYFLRSANHFPLQELFFVNILIKVNGFCFIRRCYLGRWYSRYLPYQSKEVYSRYQNGIRWHQERKRKKGSYRLPEELNSLN